MVKENVIFEIKGKKFEKVFERKKLKLGKILYIKKINDAKDIEVSEAEFLGSTRFAVKWIAQSVVSLIDSYELSYSEFSSTQKLLDNYMTEDEVSKCLNHKVSQLKLEHLYKTSEYDKSSLRVIFAVTERLKFIESLKSQEVSNALTFYWEPVVVYHLLTCFDLLGQPDSWISFNSWLISSKHSAERGAIIATLENLSNTIFSEKLYEAYLNLYGTKNSFFRFIRKIIPEQYRRELFDSIKIQTNSMPPEIRILLEDGPESEKEKFLYALRNNYTHKAQVVPGINLQMFPDLEFPLTFVVRVQEFKQDTWVIYMTKNFPQVLEHIVKIGLSEYLKKDVSGTATYNLIYGFTYKYFRAFDVNGREKAGVNRIIFNSKGEQIMRDYVSEGFPSKFEFATISEIDKNDIMYPDKKREELIRPIEEMSSKARKTWWQKLFR